MSLVGWLDAVVYSNGITKAQFSCSAYIISDGVTPQSVLPRGPMPNRVWGALPSRRTPHRMRLRGSASEDSAVA